MFVAKLKKKYYLTINFIASFLIILGSLNAAESQDDLGKSSSFKPQAPLVNAKPQTSTSSSNFARKGRGSKNEQPAYRRKEPASQSPQASSSNAVDENPDVVISLASSSVELQASSSAPNVVAENQIAISEADLRVNFQAFSSQITYPVAAPSVEPQASSSSSSNVGHNRGARNKKPVYKRKEPVLEASSSQVTYSPAALGNIGTNIFNIVSTAQNSIIIASDKCTNEEFLDDLLGLRQQKPELKIIIVTGDDETTSKIFQSGKYPSITYQSIPVNQNGGKMHNKFIIVDDRIVITGSPNATYAAYNYNIESFVSIDNPYIARLYQEYYRYIVAPTEVGRDRVLMLMNAWNGSPNIPLQICLAPISNIGTFIIQRINAAQIVNINMFMVSQVNNPDNDIVGELARASLERAEVAVKVDGGQYADHKFMRDAIDVLIANGVSAFTVLKSSQEINTRTRVVNTMPQFHDKLMLIEYKDGSKKVIIGSAGFTTNVQNNLNFENMVSINDSEIYVFLLNHFNSIENSRGGLTVKLL